MPTFDKAYFRERFAALDSAELIERGLTRELTDEAMEAIRELLQERGVKGEGLELQVNAVRKGMFRRSGVTNQCDFCGRSTHLGAVYDGPQKFCTQTCLRNARLYELSVDLAPDLVLQHAHALSVKPCPRCGRTTTPLEMWPQRWVTSIWWCYAANGHTLCCTRCGRIYALQAAVYCLVLGWWSVVGLFVTPVAITRNLRVARRGREGESPSPQLLHHARLDLAQSLQASGVLGGSAKP
jgi:hypothetical protein